MNAEQLNREVATTINKRPNTLRVNRIDLFLNRISLATRFPFSVMVSVTAPLAEIAPPPADTFSSAFAAR